MRPAGRRFLALGFLAVLAGTTTAYLAVGMDGRGGTATMAVSVLEHELRVRDARQGIAGTTGVEWVIEPSGNWRVARFINQDVQPPERHGRLDAEAMRTVVEALRTHEFERIATAAGAGPEVARAVTVSYGDRSASVPLDPTAGQLSGLVGVAEQQAEGPTAGVLAVVGTVIDVTEND